MYSKPNTLVFIIPLIICVCTMSVFGIYVQLQWHHHIQKITGVFCEVARSETIFVEPINTISNVGFIIVGLTISWQMMYRTFQKNINILTKSDVMSIIFSSLIVCIGPGSMAMHAFYTSWAVKLDITSMYFICAFLVAYSAQRLFHLSAKYFICIYLLVTFTCEWISRCQFIIPIFEYTTNLIIFCFIMLFIVLEAMVVTIQRPVIEIKWAIRSSITAASAFLIWNLSKTGGLWCYPTSVIQGHALWHLLIALALYFLFRYYVSEDNKNYESWIKTVDSDEEPLIIVIDS